MAPTLLRKLKGVASRKKKNRNELTTGDSSTSPQSPFQQPESSAGGSLSEAQAVAPIPTPSIASRHNESGECHDSSAEPSPSGILQAQIWNQAYENLRETEPQLVEAYEVILSSELHPNLSGDELSDNEIARNPEERCNHMKQLVEAGLTRTEKQVATKEQIDEGVKFIKSMTGIVDKAVQSSPEAALVWVGVCFGLEIISNPLTEPQINRDGIKYVMSRTAWYTELVDLLLADNAADAIFAKLRHELQNQILDLYQSLLSFQIKSVHLYYRNKTKTVVRDLVKYDDWNAQLSQVKAAETTAKEGLEQYNTERSRSHLQDLSKLAQSQDETQKSIYIAIQDHTKLQQEKYLNEAEQRCMQDLRETDPKSDKLRIEETKGGLLNDSYRWILENKEFQQWRTDQNSRLLWIKGDPGKGKTMLLCGIINELQKEAKNGLSYFFCQATERTLNNATAVLRGLLYLLFGQRRSLITHLQKKYSTGGTKLFEGINTWATLTEIFQNVLQDHGLGNVIFVIDALDECLSERSQLLDFIAASTSSGVKWIVSSRNNRDIQEKLGIISQGDKLDLELNAGSVSTAVRFYIRHKVGLLSERKEYDDETQKYVEDELISRANDTFLWVALVCQELEASEPWDVQETVQNMPVGLESLYQRMIEQIEGQKRRNPAMCRDLLATVTTAHQPLGIRELGCLAKIPENIQKSHNHISRLISMCGSFLTIRDSIVYIIHQSAKDFLINSTFLYESGTAQYHLRIHHASLEILTQTLRRDIYDLREPGYLLDDVISPNPDPLEPARYSCIYWIDHLVDATSEMGIADDDAVYTFLQTKSIYWIEALSLLRTYSEGMKALIKLRKQCVAQTSKRLGFLLRDILQFMLFHKPAIEDYPLQVYESGLIFSPTQSLVRKFFKADEPDWIILKPVVERHRNDPLQTLIGHRSITSLKFSPDGSHLASLSKDASIKIWNLTTGHCIHNFRHDLENPLIAGAVTFSHDGSHLATAADDSPVCIWGVDTGVLCKKLPITRAISVRELEFNQETRLLILAFENGLIDIFDIESCTCVCIRDEDNTHQMTCSPSPTISVDGQYVAYWLTQSTVRIQQTTGDHGSVDFDMGNHGGSEMALSKNGQFLATTSGDDTLVEIWNLSTGHLLNTLDRKFRNRQLMEFSQDSLRLASCSLYGRTVKIWNVYTGACIRVLKCPNIIMSLRFSPREERLAIGTSSIIELWSTSTDERNLISPQKARPEYDVGTITLSPTMRHFAIRLLDSTIEIWDTTDCVRVFRMSHKASYPHFLAFSGDGRLVAYNTSHSDISVWDVDTGNCIRVLTHQGKMNVLAFSNTGRKLILHSSEPVGFEVWDVERGLLQQKPNTPNFLEFIGIWSVIAYSEQQQKVAARAQNLYMNDRLGVFSMTGKLCWELGGDIYVEKMTITTNGQWLVTSESDKETSGYEPLIRVRDFTTGACLQTLLMHMTVEQLSFDPVIETRLQTEYGFIDLSINSIAEEAEDEEDTSLQGFGISADNRWVVKDERELLLISTDYSISNAVVAGSTIIAITKANRLLLMRF